MFSRSMPQDRVALPDLPAQQAETDRPACLAMPDHPAHQGKLDLRARHLRLKAHQARAARQVERVRQARLANLADLARTPQASVG